MLFCSMHVRYVFFVTDNDLLCLGTGKTSLAAHIAVLGHFSFVKVI